MYSTDTSNLLKMYTWTVWDTLCPSRVFDNFNKKSIKVYFDKMGTEDMLKERREDGRSKKMEEEILRETNSQY